MLKKVVSFLCFFIALNGISQLLTFKNINHKNGLNLSSVLSVTQDKNGYIWLGTDGFGLQQYDGKLVKTINVDPADNEHHVTYIDPVDKGLYFSSRYKGFYQFLNNKLVEIVPKQRDFGERLAIKKIGKSLLLIGEKKIELIQGNKILNELVFTKQITRLTQVLEVTNGIILTTDQTSYYITEKQILPLKKWLKSDIKPIVSRFYENKIEFFERNKTVKTIAYLTKEGTIFSKESKKFEYRIDVNFRKVYARGKSIFALSDANEIYHFKGNRFKLIPKNIAKTNFRFESLFIDHNDDFWATSTNSGIYKISDEPFTKIELDDVYRGSLINFIYKDQSNDIVLSTFDSLTYHYANKSTNFVRFNLKVNGVSRFKDADLYATNKGVMQFKNGIFSPFEGIKNRNKIIFIYAVGNDIYFCPSKEGLYKYNHSTKKTTKLFLANSVSHIYTAQINFNQTKIYFGTNDGLYEYGTKTGKVTIISSKFKSKGSYSGVSCIDSYGTLWFTYDTKIVGITKREEYLVIEDKKYFKSSVFYTLNADPYGNLIIGTNVGITKLKIDHLGNVVSHFEYNANNGFNGFETHMRSSFQDGKIIYVGTIEGLFSINTEKLEYLPNPPKPLVFQLKEKKNNSVNSDEELIKLSYLVLNPKLTGIQYTYRLKGKSKYWSDITPKTEVYFSNLSDQEYIFQVRSTYDGLNFSPIANYKIVKNTPFWKTKWFILFLILSIALANIIVLDRSKSFELSQIIENQDIEINSRIRNIILVFGLVFNTGTQYFAYFLDSNLTSSIALNTFAGGILVSLIFLSIGKHPFPQIKKYLLQIALFVVVGQAFLSAYLSSIHPFHVIVIALTTALTPFILNRISQVIVFSVFQIIAVISIVFLVEYPIYNGILFLVTIIVSICLSIFTTYIRNESLQKLIFISDIINKGNLIAIAFNQNNKITYISENMYDSMSINPSTFLGKHISELNQFVFQKLTKRKIDFTNEFQDDQIHIIPMKKEDGTEKWIEWSCKIFSNKVKVIFGQDISERIKIENNYESLVENAQDLIYYVDVNGVFIYTNNKFQEVLGYQGSELVGRDSWFIVNTAYQEELKAFFFNQFKDKTLNTYNEILVRKKDGTEIWIGQNTTILYAFGSQKIVKGFLCIARDITEKKAQQSLIEKQHESIKSSTDYAKKIQYNLLPKHEKIQACFSEFSVFSKAKDNVSGDFYWFEKVDSKIIFVLSDCTGHGVPGAFMTLLGINLLNQIILEDKHLKANDILNMMDAKLAQILPRDIDSNLRDGMEMIVFIHDTEKMAYEFASAGSKFIVQSKGEFSVYRGESKHIGENAESNFEKYNTYELSEKEVDAFYFFTDGIQEQISESTATKFSLKKLIDILKKNPSDSVEDQILEVQVKHEKWKGKAQQSDDITVIGFKF